MTASGGSAWRAFLGLKPFRRTSIDSRGSSCFTPRLCLAKACAVRIKVGSVDCAPDGTNGAANGLSLVVAEIADNTTSPDLIASQQKGPTQNRGHDMHPAARIKYATLTHFPSGTACLVDSSRHMNGLIGSLR
jgi:hypothetical protein